MSNSEEMLTAIINEEVVNDEPQCRKEQFLKAIANNEGAANLPEPSCREEKLLLQIAEKGLGGGITPKGELRISENGIYDVTYQSSVNVDIGAGEEIIIDLPEEFDKQSDVYSFVVNDDIVLFGAFSSIGLWRYKISSNTWDQLYQYGAWGNFMMVDNKVFIGKVTTNIEGLLVYDVITDTAERNITTGLNYKTVNVIDNFAFITGGSSDTGIVVYNRTTETVTKFETGGYSDFGTFLVHGNKILITGNSSSVIPAYSFDTKTETLKYLIDMPKCVYTINIGNNILFSSSVSSTNCRGIWRYNGDTDTMDKIYEEGYSYYHMTIVGNKVLINSNQSAIVGIFLYDLTSDTIEKIYDTGYNWIFHTIKDKCLIVSGTSSVKGVLVFNSNDNSIIQPYTSGSSLGEFHDIGDNCLIASRSNTGILRYRYADDNIVLIHSSGKYWTHSFVINNCLFISAGSESYAAGLYRYNNDTDTFYKVLSNGSQWVYAVQIGNAWFISSINSTNGKGLYKYNPETLGFDLKLSYSYRYNEIIEQDGVQYIKGNNNILVRYDEATDTVSVDKYKLEV